MTKCPICDDDGWVDVLDEDGFPVGARECERLNDPGHAAFNATGLLPDPDADASGEAAALLTKEPSDA